MQFCFRHAGFALATVLLLTPACLAVAEDDSVERAVRLTLVDGSVKITGVRNPASSQRRLPPDADQGSTQLDAENQPAAADQDAVQNMPVLEGMSISTGQDGKVVAAFDDGSLVRETPASDVEVVHTGPDGNGVRVRRGLVYFEARGSRERPFTIAFASAQASVRDAATIRVNLDAVPAELAVLAGSAEVSGSGEGAGEFTAQLRAGQTIAVARESGSVPYALLETVNPDSWDQWSREQQDVAAQAEQDRTQAAEESGATGDSSGWSDLDAYGNWYPAGDAGLVWQPPDYSADFDPYAEGYWGYYQGYGYTWISGYAWGWTPYHCGAWSFFPGFGWGWQPAGGCYGYFAAPRFRQRPAWYPAPVRPHPPTGINGPRPVVLTKARRPIVRPPEGVTILAGKGKPALIGGRPVEPLRPIRPAALQDGAVLNTTRPGVTRQPTGYSSERVPYMSAGEPARQPNPMGTAATPIGRAPYAAPSPPAALRQDSFRPAPVVRPLPPYAGPRYASPPPTQPRYAPAPPPASTARPAAPAPTPRAR